ncbi:hypothetical protein MesoLjLc_33820 [Mesorhizobium sp. L-8-10]|nr:hypothetical protein MesoLjLb_35090 [Mesorhizobium sp. L-8-3]BCH31452.1 hypothetical protein MesoLjLc_33820 [Mesorhizobium sp. L-8-10]
MMRAIDWGRRKRNRERDDRLLKDMGLSPEQVLGPGRVFWSEWERQREPWLL